MTQLLLKQKEAIKRSGYLMEQEIAAKIKQSGFYTVPNYAFVDPEDGTSREIDVFGMSATKFGNKTDFEFFYPILLVEVKNVEPLVCFTQSEVKSHYTMGELQISGFPENIWKGGKGILLPDFLKLDKFHHYYKRGRIASQFCLISETKKGEFVASHKLGDNRNLYDEIIIPLVHGVEYEKADHYKEWEFNRWGESINLQFYYPILVVKSLYECFVEDRKYTYRKVHRLNFIRRYHSKNISGEYRIDVCDKKGLNELIKIIDSEMNIVAKKIRKNKALFERSAYVDALQRAKLPFYKDLLIKVARKLGI